MAWYEVLMAFIFVMSLVITPAVVITKRKNSIGKKEADQLAQRITELENLTKKQELKIAEQDLENNKIKHEIEFMTRLIEQKK